MALATLFDDELTNLSNTWSTLLRDQFGADEDKDHISPGMLRLIYGFARLYVLSFTLHNPFGSDDGQLDSITATQLVSLANSASSAH